MLVSLWLLTAVTGALAQDEEALVLTSLPVTYSLTSELTAGTGITVQNLPERGRRLNGLGNYFAARGEQLYDTFAAASAVVTIGKLWRDDPLYTAARSGNIRIVDIDATKPWSRSLEGISVAFEPEQDARWLVEGEEAERAPSVYFWHSPANAARAAEIIARDLMRLFPDNEERINENLHRLRRDLLELKREYEVKLAELADVTVFALAPEFVYLTNDLGLYVDGYFFKQDLDWTADDLSAFGAYLSENGIRVVLHKWEPEAPIVAAIESAGAQVVVLETLDAGIVEDGRMLASSYFDMMQANFEAVHEALLAANRQ